MPTFNTDNFVQAVLADVSNLAATLFKSYVGQAETDPRAFIQASKDTIASAASLYQQGQIDQDELEDIINDQKALAEMHALKNTGLASAAIDTFCRRSDPDHDQCRRCRLEDLNIARSRDSAGASFLLRLFLTYDALAKLFAATKVFHQSLITFPRPPVRSSLG